MSETRGGHGQEIAAPAAADAYLVSTQTYAATDLSFRQDAVAAAGAAGVENATRLVALHARFDHPSYVTGVDGVRQAVPHYPLHRFLRVVPTYIERSAAAGLTPDQAAGLVETLLAAEDRDEWSTADQPVVYLGKALELQAQTHGPITAEDYAQVQGLIADTASHEDDNASALDAYRALSRLGMSTVESIRLIREGLLTDSLLMNRALEVFNALAIAEVDTQVLGDICRQFIGTAEDHPHISAIQEDFALLRECIVTAGPRQDIHPNRLLESIHAQLRQGKSMLEIANGFVSARRLAQTIALEVGRPEERIAQHFLTKTGPLEASPLPYRAERSFDEGAHDLGAIALNSMRYREALQEGFWVFDPNAMPPVWYSLGGETELGAGVVRHSYPAYPLQELSRSPTVAHCHPADLEWAISPGLSNGVYPNMAMPVIDRFLAATPSGQDYQMIADILRASGGPQTVRSIFAHGSGLTEYTFPQDPDVLEHMAQISRSLRDNFLLGIDWSKVLYTRKFAGLLRGELRGVDTVVRDLMERFDNGMPKGFGLHLLDLGTEQPYRYSNS